MTPFRIGDDIRVKHGAGALFAGCTGSVVEVYEAAETLMIELERFGARLVPTGMILPFAAAELESVRCQHPRVTEAELEAYINRRWGGESPHCPDCNEWLYPDDTGDGIRIYVGEPRGAGADVGAW